MRKVIIKVIPLARLLAGVPRTHAGACKVP
jgi:hypothetical protein